MSKADTHKQHVLQYLMERGSITTLDAFRFNPHCTRLAAVIHVLKKRGYVISTEMEEYINEDGFRSRYARYTLESTPTKMEG